MGISRFWMVFFAGFMSLAWLLPNRAYPWTSFHNDAWLALMVALVSLVVCVRLRWRMHLEVVGVLVLGVAAVPLLQFAAGQIYLPGVAWVNAAYVLGFAVAILVGSAWSKVWPGEATALLLLAMTIAGVASVFLQLNQFFYLRLFGEWGLPGIGSRPFGNLGQPNQLASLQMLAVLGVAWAYCKGMFHGRWAVALILVLFVGLVLTESRTAWLGLVCMASLAVWKHDLLPSRRTLWVIAGLLLVFFFMVSQLRAAYVFFDIDANGGLSRSLTGDPRWQLWREVWQAVLLQPLTGYGWGQGALVNAAVFDARIATSGNYLQAHNMFLDLLVWNGVPLGLCLIGGIVAWYVYVFFRIQTIEQLLQVMFVSVLMIHAMLEYPLQYAYFLLPLGWVVGELTASTSRRTTWLRTGSAHSVLPGVLVVGALALLLVLIVDYFKVENRFLGLRFELKNIPTDIPRTPPNVLLLTQWADYLEFARVDPQTPLDAATMRRFEQVVYSIPTVLIQKQYAMTLAFAHQPEHAARWLRRICSLNAPEQCNLALELWKIDAQTYPEMKAVELPQPATPAPSPTDASTP